MFTKGVWKIGAKVMVIKQIKTEGDYNAALKRVESLFRAKPDTPSGDGLEMLIALVSAYEDEHYKIST